VPLVGTPATNRTRTPRKRISSLETGIAAVRQPQDSGPVSPGRRLLCCYLGRVGPSFHFRSFLTLRLLHRCQIISSVFCKLCYNYILHRSRKQARTRSSGGHASAVYCWPTASFLDVDPHRLGHVWRTHREIDATGSNFADLRAGQYQRNPL
jgi:hypothetical protein